MEVSGKHIHFMGIGGIGMSAIARIALERGAVITGCDLKANGPSSKLVDAGAVCYLGHSPTHLGHEPVDTLVYSSAIPQDNAELKAARENGIEVISRSNMLSRLMEDRAGIAITGAHGKTTTTWLIANILMNAGLDPTVMVGGVVPTLEGNFREGAGDLFVTEVDESDGMLLEITPTYSVLTNVDAEHLDHYSGIEEIVETFAEYLSRTRPGGKVIGCVDDERVAGLLGDCGFETIGYGLGKSASLRAEMKELTNCHAAFDVRGFGGDLPELNLAMPGEHNVKNALAAIAVARIVGVEEEIIRMSLLTCPRVGRRFEIRSREAGIRIVDDYAHHPTEVAATIRAARPSTDRRLVVVFQPHRYTRTQALSREFGPAFLDTDHLVVTAIYSANEPPVAGLTGAVVAESAREAGCRSVEYIPNRESILDHLASILEPGDTVMTMGAGDIGTLGDELRERILSRD